MSFSFQWPQFSDQFHADATAMLEAALNKGDKPPVIAGKIEVVELHMGTQPPELEIRDIGDLTLDQFRGIFRLSYAGDAYIVLRTKVQANPLNHKQPDIHLISGSRGILAAHQPLVVPMLLRLSNFRLTSYVVLVVSKQKGITLVFKTDPLQNVDINSTFDSIAVIQSFIQREIEEQLRQMFRQDLPSIIHRLSQQWVKAKVEAPYLDKQQPEQPPPPPSLHIPEMEPSEVPFHSRMPLVGLGPSMAFSHGLPRPSMGPRRVTSLSSVTSSSARQSTTTSRTSRSAPYEDELSDSPFGDAGQEPYDPTYGLRPEGIPVKNAYTGFGRLFSPTRGLGDLAEEGTSDGYDTDDASFDVVEWEDTAPFADSMTITSEPADMPMSLQKFETLPAVGGGTITRPRILHSQSNVVPPREIRSRSPDPLNSRRAMSARTSLSPPTSPRPEYPTRPMWSSLADLRSAGLQHHMLRGADLRSFDRMDLYLQETSPLRRGRVRGGSPDSFTRQPTRGSPSSSNIATSPPSETPTPPPDPDISEPPHQHQHPRPSPIDVSHRRASTSSSSAAFDAFVASSSPSEQHHHLHNGGADDPERTNIVLRPTHNHSVSQLAMLSHSYHTLSPYARSMEHFAVRSGPPRVVRGHPAERGPVKGKRKRMYRLGGSAVTTPSAEPAPQHQLSPPPSPPSPSSEFDVADLDRYFRSRDDLPPPSIPDVHPSHMRRRASYATSGLSLL